MVDLDWGESDITEVSIQRGIAKYNAPIENHNCDVLCKKSQVNKAHDIQSIFDDFELSLRQREIMTLELARARGREQKERLTIRMFVGTANNKVHYIRLQTSTDLTIEVMGECPFDTKDMADKYYNHCIDIFGFSKDLKIETGDSLDWDMGDKEEDDLDWGDEDDEEMDWSDPDDDEEGGWDIDDD